MNGEEADSSRLAIEVVKKGGAAGVMGFAATRRPAARRERRRSIVGVLDGGRVWRLLSKGHDHAKSLTPSLSVCRKLAISLAHFLGMFPLKTNPHLSRSITTTLLVVPTQISYIYFEVTSFQQGSTHGALLFRISQPKDLMFCGHPYIKACLCIVHVPVFTMCCNCTSSDRPDDIGLAINIPESRMSAINCRLQPDMLGPEAPVWTSIVCLKKMATYIHRPN